MSVTPPRRQTISLEFQESYCLGGPYEDCVRYHAAQTGATASQPVETVASFDEPDARVVYPGARWDSALPAWSFSLFWLCCCYALALRPPRPVPQ
ncbi:MAG: hypothetical protein HZY76_15850 [Anaerolineae bacterium]|nr:MAG: hypothetical protein HZY76_15850 [Anaerolineae bacterium]